ncbi:MAG: DUF2007 domain-containing protein [Bryobacteraceae bacterium]|nr:hypothetical protein [Solibacteraceae bacterium]MCL4844827.1 hypothetical protein [Bryobacteraceae bacterium]MCO5353670.1 DUF2007 domain-containing protein [Bryobacteraceae bacterium]
MEEQNQHPELEMVPLTDGELELAVSDLEAASLKSLLATAGIEAVVVGASPLPNLPNQIHVPAGRLEEAVALVREARETGEALEEAEGE